MCYPGQKEQITMTSRELVHRTLEFRNGTGRVPRELWYLEWAKLHYPVELKRIKTDFPNDLVDTPGILHTPRLREHGDAWRAGEYVDAWGCTFTNIQDGVVGQTKKPLVAEEDWSDWENVHIPVEWLDFEIEQVNAYCAQSDKFCNSGCCPRPFEQLQFIRTTEMLYVDLMDPPADFLKFLGKMHSFYCDQVEKWARTDVDGIKMMDDWGSQRSLLINPVQWRKYFKPMYQDYIDIAKRYEKKTFMHSDGYTLDILPELIEMGLDAINTQIFCIGLDQLEQFKGKLTFWGEIDRQDLLPNASTDEIAKAVRDVHDTLWDNGGCIAQCEFGAGARPENVYTVYKTWDSYGK